MEAITATKQNKLHVDLELDSNYEVVTTLYIYLFIIGVLWSTL